MITENSIVRLKMGVATQFPREKATVIGYVFGVKGGVNVMPPLERLSAWNIKDLEEVPKRKKRESPKTTLHAYKDSKGNWRSK
jgi:hypothetical protein